MNLLFGIERIYKRIVPFVITLFVFTNSYAGIETATNRTASPSLNNMSVLKVLDDKYAYMKANPTSWQAAFNNKKMTDRIIFSVDQSSSAFQSASFDATIHFRLTSETWSTVSNSFVSAVEEKTMVISYNKTGSYTDKAVFELQGAQGMTIQVLDFTNTANIPYAQLNVSLEAEIETERYYHFDPLFVPATLSHKSNALASNGELEIYWDAIPGAEEYDLEWLYINNYDYDKINDQTSEIPASDLKIDERIFQFNSSRISTSDNYYKIPYIYGKGYILYRIRGVGKTDKDNYANLISGLWSTNNYTFSTVAAFAKKFPNPSLSGPLNPAEQPIAHEDHLNWQFSVNYAEEGKSKAVVNYFDGSLRTRQSVTKSKTIDQIVVGENIYDYQGRPAIQVLPVPVNSAKIGFNKNFNQNTNALPYSKKDFDTDAGTCEPVTAPMRASDIGTPNVGAANYYSSENNDKIDQQAYVPDAHQYPFSQVEYTPDNTGRMSAQSVVGEAFKLGTKRETNYFYLSPSQFELDRLFGSEVGDALHYKKNAVRDANGQLSISFLDLHGKVIATCLAGTSPLNVDPLTGSDPKQVKEDLLNKVHNSDFTGSKNILDLSSKTLQVTKQFAPEKEETRTFSYKVNGQKYQEMCLAAQPRCYDCVYDLNISLTDECNQEYLTGVSTPVQPYTTSRLIGDPNKTPPTIDCNVTPSLFEIGYNGDAIYPWQTKINNSVVKLDPTKTYTLTKTLKLNQTALDRYTQDYLNSSCVMKLDDFVQAEIAKVDFSGCNMTCQECANKLGGYDQYDKHLNPACSPCLTKDEFQQLVDKCYENCDTKSERCEVGLENMMIDMSPMGQYGQIMPGGGVVNKEIVDLDPNTFNPEAYPLSVFNEANLLPRKFAYTIAYNGVNWAPTWRFPYDPSESPDKQLTYVNEDGSIAYIPITETATGSNVYSPEIIDPFFAESLPTGQKVVRPQFLKDLKVFLSNWKPEWSKALVAYHPEYGYYEFCKSIASSHDFDEAILNYDQLSDLPWTSTIAGTNLKQYMNPVLSGIDWYFTTNNPHFSLAEKNAMLYAMQNYAGGKSIWELAYITANCPNKGGDMECSFPSCNYTAGSNFTRDEEWNIFKGLYFSLKQKFVQQVSTQYAIKNGFYNGCIGVDQFDPFLNHFFQSIQPNNSHWISAPYNFAFFRSQFYNFEQPCNFAREELYKEKQMRFPGVSDLLDMGSLNANTCYSSDFPMDPPNDPEPFEVVDCAAKTQAILDEAENETSLALYQQCGQCPNAHNLELFLNALVTTKTGDNEVINNLVHPDPLHVSCSPTGPYPEFTQNLAKAFNLFSSKADIVYSSSVSDNELGAIFESNGQSCGMSFKFTTIPTGTAPNPGMDRDPDHLFTNNSPTGIKDLYTFSDIVKLCCLKYIPNPTEYPLNQNRNFQVTATVKVKSGDPIFDPLFTKYRELIVEGYSGCFDVGGCEFQPICKTNAQGIQLQTLFNTLLYRQTDIEETFIKTTEVALSAPAAHYNKAYEVLQPALNTVKGITPDQERHWSWKLLSSTGNLFTAQLKEDAGNTFTINFQLVGSYTVNDILSFSNMRPDPSGAQPGALGAFLITALVKSGTNTPAYIDVIGSIEGFSVGACTDNLPDGMENGNTNTTSGGLGKTCTPSAAAINLQAELNATYIKATKTRDFICSNTNGEVLEFTASGCMLGLVESYNSGYLYFPIGSPYGNCTPVAANQGNFETYKNIVDLSGIVPDPDYARTGYVNTHFIIYATMQSGVKVQLKGRFDCIAMGSCDEIPPDCSEGENKVKNGDFEQNNSNDFTSDMVYTASELSLGNYTFGSDASTMSGGSSVGVDHTTGTGLFMGVHSNGQNHIIWKQNGIAVEKNTYYTFSTWVSSLHQGEGDNIVLPAVHFSLSVNGDVSGSSSSQVFAGPLVINSWIELQFSWYSGNNTVADLKITDALSSGASQRYEYGLDDISFRSCRSKFICDIANIPLPDPEVDPNPCSTMLIQIATTGAEEQYNQYIEGIRKQFQEKYTAKCLDVYEEFWMDYEDTQHHFTLYYYDQAGNLVRTIPPAGVHPVTHIDASDPTDNEARVTADMDRIKSDRSGHTHTFFTKHTMATTYKYNSLNQLVAQTSPDVQNLEIWKPLPINIPADQLVTNTAFSDATHGSAFTKDANGIGHIYTTSDGGKIWAEVSDIGISDLNDVQYTSANTAYAVGKGGIVMKTTTGGTNWDIATPPTTLELFRVFFDDDMQGMAFAINGAEWVTSDGGANWIRTGNLDIALGGGQLTDMSFSNSTGVAVTATGTIFTSTDKGVIWLPSKNIRTVDLNKGVSIRNTRIIIGKDGKLLKSYDNGLSWKQMETPVSTDLKNMYFDYPNEGWVIDAAGVVRKTDGVIQWDPIQFDASYPTPVYKDIFFNLPTDSYTGPVEGYAFTQDGAISTLNYATDKWSVAYPILTTFPSGTVINKLFCIAPYASTHLGFMGASNGKIYKRGANDGIWDLWTTIGSGEGIKDMYFSMQNNSLQGIVLTTGGKIYYAADGKNFGAPAGLSSTENYRTIFFESEAKAYAISDNNSVAQTSDRGATWSTIPTSANTQGHPINSMFLDYAGAGFMVGEAGEIWNTSGNASNWTDVSGTVNLKYLSGVKLSDDNTAYALGMDGIILKSTNVAASDAFWSEQVTNTSRNLTSIAFSPTDINKAVVVGESGFIMRTLNSGTSWTNSSISVNITTNLKRAVFAGSNVFAVGANCMRLKSSDGGANWDPFLSYGVASPEELRGISTNGSNVLAVGTHGKIFQWNGTTWLPQNIFIPPVLQDTKMLGNYGIAVGDRGSILTTTNGGAQWDVQASGTVENLRAVYISPSNKANATVVGENGTVINTTNSGVSWTQDVNFPQPGPSTHYTNLNDIHFAKDFGIIVGDGGKAYTKVNQGSWLPALPSTPVATTANLHAVYVVDNLFAFAAGDNGTLLKVTRTDEYATPLWKQKNSGSTNFTDIFFRDYVTGYAIGNGGTLLKTINGGDTWELENLNAPDPTLPTTNYTDLTVIDNNNVIVSGNSGSVTHLEDLKDEFASMFWYDKLGRLIASQNAKQYNKPGTDHLVYAYTIYDELNRIQQVGEVKAVAAIETIYNDGFSSADFLSWLATGIKTEVTTTIYDVPTCASCFPQDNLRKRVSATYYDEQDADIGNGYDYATHYSYDIHGNVKSLIQDNPGLASIAAISQQYKRIDYEYDLISGNVKKVSYQAGAPDAFYHKYEYDADNRITQVYTSKDNVSWDQDAKYFYYKHGPLSRVELGNEKVQGIDYAYTLQGWIKGINSTNLDVTKDIGKDAKPDANNVDKNIAKDVYSYSLNYYREKASATDPIGKDYASIGGDDDFMASVSNAAYTAPNLYNGNISSMATTIMDNIAGGAPIAKPQLTAYHYDQLNRITAMNAYHDLQNTVTGNDWSVATDDGSYQSAVSYDPNGNIQHMKTNGASGNIVMDDLSYVYENASADYNKPEYGNIANNYKKITNKLTHVKDAHTSTYTDDIEDQGALVAKPNNGDGYTNDNYAYDEIGNLTKDNQEHITSIEWTLYGKIKRILYDNEKRETVFNYDAFGNRIEKKERLLSGTIETFYVRDAQGNVLSSYKFGANLWNNPTVEYHQCERMICGSKRIGIDNTDYNFTNPPAATPGFTTHVIGNKTFELSNHLNNVLSTVSDRKIAVSSNTTTVESYVADVKTANDYYPFGTPMPKRGIDGKYRYGFGGQEKDDDILGRGNSYTAEFWEYDSRLGRRWNRDPIVKYWESPYASLGDNPLIYIDPLGLDWYKNDNTGAVIWNEGDAESITRDKLEYNNIGATYTDRKVVGNDLMITYYNQNVRVGFEVKTFEDEYVNRTSWGASSPIIESGRDYELVKNPKEYYKFIVIHHAGNTNSPTIQDIQDKHQNGKAKKADVGYHFAIDAQGKIYEGRPINRKGAHVKNANTGAIGILLLGDFDETEEGLFEWTSDKYEKGGAMEESLLLLVNYLKTQYKIESISGHCEVNCGHTVCPGDEVKSRLNYIRQSTELPATECITNDSAGD